MAYTINKTDGSVLATVVDCTINTTAINITLIGKIISEKGIHFDSHLDMENIKKFDHFS